MEIEVIFKNCTFLFVKMQFDDRLTFFVNNSEYFSDISMYSCVLSAYHYK